MRERRHPLVMLVSLAACPACGGESLSVGYNDATLGRDPAAPVDLADVALRCAARTGEPEPRSGSPAVTMDAGRALLVGRWIGCPDNVLSDRLPAAVEFVPGAAFELRPGADAVYERGPQELVSTTYSLGYEGFTVEFRDAAYRVTWERNPMRMTWTDGPVTHRFARY